jgi:hypothetical protein
MNLTLRLKSLQHETLQPQVVNTFGIVLAKDTIWWMLLATYKYMHIWLGGAWLICIKLVLSYHFLKVKLFLQTYYYIWSTWFG